MFEIKREIHFCYGHRLMEYAGKCRHPHGHNGIAEVVLFSEKLDKLGMVMDFDEIKRHLQTWVDESLDHKMLLRQDDPLVDFLKKSGEPVYLMDENPTAENIARAIFQEGRKKGLPVARVSLWETPKSCATYGEDSAG